MIISLSVFLLTLGVYTATLGPTTDFWDCGEYITTSHIVGVPHQPGTPLYVLVGRVFDVVLGDADITVPAYRTAWAINFMSAFFSSLAVMLVYLVIWELARRANPDSGLYAHVGGVVGALFLAFSETFWNNAVEAEVYGLSAFMLILLTWLSLKWYDHRQHPGSNLLVLLMIYLLGLGVGFHLGAVLVYPGIFLVMVFASRRQLPLVDILLLSSGLGVFLLSTMWRNNDGIMLLLLVYAAVVILRAVTGHRFALWGSLLFGFALTVHYMMMIRAGANPEPYINQTDPETFDVLMSVIRREQYPPLSEGGRKAPILWQYGYYYKFLLKQFYFLGNGTGMVSLAATVLGPFFLAFLGLVQGFRRLKLLILLPVVNYLINGEILTLVLNFSDHEVRDRDYFYFAAFLFFAVFIGLGAAALLRFSAGPEGKTARELIRKGQAWRTGITPVKAGAMTKVTAVVLMVLVLLPMWPGHTKFVEHDRSDNRIAYEYAWNILAGVDENAIIFTNGDNDTFPIWYLQAVEHFRKDVSVVNLSLVNLPWYIKQLRTLDHPVEMKRTDPQIDQLRHRRMRDAETGEETILMIKDYVLHDIITTNHERAGRPVFFAVTIPQENMARYYPMLQMEGMTYRLMETASEDKMPTIEPQKVLDNMLGRYKLSSVMTGQDDRRQSRFAEQAGLLSDTGTLTLGQEGDRLSPVAMDTLAQLLGSQRRDVYRNQNANHLLGNYPAALNRAGYEFYNRADRAARVDSVEYKRNLKSAIVAFETSLAIEPYNEMAMEFYPLLLVMDYRDETAKDFLSSLADNVSPALEERIVFNSLSGFVRGGVTELALDWVAGQVAAYPDRHFYYQVQFSLHQALNQVSEAEAVLEAWRQQNGQVDPEMESALTVMRQNQLKAEQDRINNAVGDPDGQ